MSDACIQAPIWAGPSKPGLQKVFGLPSNANTARALRSPGNLSLEPITAPPNTFGPPRMESITLSGISADTRAVPLSENVRVVGNQNVLLIASSGSERGGVADTRSRVITKVSRCESEESPSTLSRSEGIWTVSPTLTVGIRTSEKPTPDAPCIDWRPDQVVPSTVIRRVEKVRFGNRIVWPPACRDAEVKVAPMAWPPSSSTVTRVIHRFTDEPSTCTKLRWSVVTG